MFQTILTKSVHIALPKRPVNKCHSHTRTITYYRNRHHNIYTISKNPIIVKNPITLECKSSMNDIVDTIRFNTYIITKGVLLFTFFYCSMNWWFYRQMRKDNEDDDNKNT
jgi:hypothetical protein